MRPLNLSACENGPSWDVINNFTTYSYNHSYTDNKFFHYSTTTLSSRKVKKIKKSMT